MPTISRKCPSCEKYSRAEFKETPMACPECKKEWGLSKKENIFDECLGCQCRHFYRHRDFNQALGCAIMLIGIILVPFTYGISLPVLALFDWLLFRKTKEVVLCYRCGIEFRDFKIPDWINTFEHHLGDKYQEKKSSE